MSVSGKITLLCKEGYSYEKIKKSFPEVSEEQFNAVVRSETMDKKSMERAKLMRKFAESRDGLRVKCGLKPLGR